MAKEYLNQLKTLRSQKSDLKELNAVRREQEAHEKAILAAIETEPKTVPEIAEQTRLPEQRVFWMVNALRKYNKAESVKKRGEYMTYIKK
jgi:predicted Rossmann fold nucleotide-binding protein DprA/Smf involved in DNA uptake